MMVTCILTSYNRPNFIRQALKSIEQQTHQDYELLVMDESTIFDIHEVVKEFKLRSVWIHHAEVSPEERKTTNRLSIQINLALARALGALVCYLADDDYLFPDWFEEGSKYFAQHQNILQGFGSLHYSGSPHMDYSQTSGIRFFDKPISDPVGKLDHNQVMHRRRNVLWPATPDTMREPDGHFFKELAKASPFYPMMNACSAIKRLHPKNLQRCLGGSLEGSRE